MINKLLACLLLGMLALVSPVFAKSEIQWWVVMKNEETGYARFQTHFLSDYEDTVSWAEKYYSGVETFVISGDEFNDMGRFSRAHKVINRCLVPDYEKCIEIQQKDIVQLRDLLLRSLDFNVLRALEDDDKGTLSNLREIRKYLRDIPETFSFDNYYSLEELKHAWPWLINEVLYEMSYHHRNPSGMSVDNDYFEQNPSHLVNYCGYSDLNKIAGVVLQAWENQNGNKE